MRLDSRHLLTDGGETTLASSALASGAKLCDFCTRQDTCELDRSLHEARCDVFAPVFSFVPPILGLEGKFNTFRSSSIWYDRARVIFRGHKEVGLVNAKDGQLVGMAKMIGAFRGPFKQLMKEHAHANHLTQAGKIDEAEAPEWLARKIRVLAGKRYVKSDEQVGTVIYLERV